MFELSILKQDLLTPLLIVAAAIGKKQSLPLLSHILLTLSENELRLTATDHEIEISALIPCSSAEKTGMITVPSKKFVDIIRLLDDDANPTIQFNDQVVSIREGRSLFKLSTLPAEDFPRAQDNISEVELTISTAAFTRFLQSSHFAISQQDVRVFLNCLLIEIDPDGMVAVGTDGHRMAIARLPMDCLGQQHRLLIPRKGIIEMLRLIQPISDEFIILTAGSQHVKLTTSQYTFTSKLVAARFPVYSKAIPRSLDKSVIINKDILKRVLSRIIILSNEKVRAIMLHIQLGQITLIANNHEQEEAIESLEAETTGDELKIGVNATYLLDVLGYLNDGSIRLSFSTPDSSFLIESPNDPYYQYVIMPMKL